MLLLLLLITFPDRVSATEPSSCPEAWEHLAIRDPQLQLLKRVVGDAIQEQAHTFVSHPFMPFGGFMQVSENRFRVSVPEIGFAYRASPYTRGRQRESNWCWAACLQMIFDYFGIVDSKGLPITEEMLVAEVYGRLPSGALPDKPADDTTVAALLNNVFRNVNGSTTQIEAHVTEDVQNNKIAIAKLLANKMPLLVGLRGSATNAPGHAYLVTGMEFSVDPIANDIVVHSVTVRDPWPENLSEQTMTWENFLDRQIFTVSVVPH